MANLAKIISAIPVYTSRFGVLAGIRLGLSTLAPKVMPVGRLCQIRIPGVKTPFLVRAGTSDIKAFHQVFVEGDHAITSTTSPKTIIDAGANIGCASVFFSQQYPHARILAVEPDESNFQLLKRNTEAYPNIIPVRGAVWPEGGFLSIENPEAEHWARRVTASEGSDKLGVRAISVNEMLALLDSTTIDLFKIDIEGAEKELFEGETSGWIDAVKVFAIEFHDYLKPGCRASFTLATSHVTYLCERRGEYDVFMRS